MAKANNTRAMAEDRELLDRSRGGMLLTAKYNYTCNFTWLIKELKKKLLITIAPDGYLLRCIKD